MDDLDWKILALLQDNGRISYTELARQVRGGLTRSDSFLRFLSGTSEAIMLPI